MGKLVGRWCWVFSNGACGEGGEEWTWVVGGWEGWE